MAEKKAVGHAYNIDFLNVVFAASSIFLFISTIWMVWDDFDREWKNTQRQFTQLELEVTRQQLAQNARTIDKAKLTSLQNQLAAAQKVGEAMLALGQAWAEFESQPEVSIHAASSRRAASTMDSGCPTSRTWSGSADNSSQPR